MIWFTSDWHLGHTNIIKYCNRPFKDVDEMDKTILDNFFSLVKEGDTVYFLGDLTFKNEIVLKVNSLFCRNGIKVFYVKGNHDAKNYLSDLDIREVSINGQPITLCHYPMLSWNKSHFGAWQLHGHHHNNRVAEMFPGKRCNVAVDNWDFKPVSFEQLKEYMDKQPNNWDYIEGREVR